MEGGAKMCSGRLRASLARRVSCGGCGRRSGSGLCWGSWHPPSCPHPDFWGWIVTQRRRAPPQKEIGCFRKVVSGGCARQGGGRGDCRGAEQTLHTGLGDMWTRWDPEPTPWRAGLFHDLLHAMGRADGQGALSSVCSPSPLRTRGAPWGPTWSPACCLSPPSPPRLWRQGVSRRWPSWWTFLKPPRSPLPCLITLLAPLS